MRKNMTYPADLQPKKQKSSIALPGFGSMLPRIGKSMTERSKKIPVFVVPNEPYDNRDKYFWLRLQISKNNIFQTELCLCCGMTRRSNGKCVQRHCQIFLGMEQTGR